MSKYFLNRLALAGLLLALPTWGFLVYLFGDDHHHNHLAWSLFVVVVFLVVVLALFEWSGRASSKPARARFGYLEITLGADGRFSTSKSVVALWTLVLAASLMFLSGLAWFTTVDRKDVFGGDWNSYFLLLGGPFASAVLAKGIVLSAINKDPAAKSATSSQSGTAVPSATMSNKAPSGSDLVSNDAGDTDLVDSQYVIFSLVAIAYFLGALVSAAVRFGASRDAPPIVLPSIPAALLGLTSLAALTYVGNKAVTAQGLRVVKMEPNPVVNGSKVTITVINLPPTATVGNTYIALHDSAGAITNTAPVTVSSMTGEITFVAPAPAGTYQISIIAPDTVAGPLSLTTS
ncbi:MAG: hypothetical protein QOE76_3255 [Frankiales bacterium]|jgi:hypothetical protein|nr:hypothetical protein [Frankiales bacterium]